MIRKIFPQFFSKLSSCETIIVHENRSFHEIEFDSRDIQYPKDTLFVCIIGEKTNGHHYISSLIKQGVKNFLISDSSFQTKEANFYLFKDTISGFQQLVSELRKEFKQEVVAITGSNGKTTIKEWLAQLLGSTHNICKSPKSYNSQIGVPYSVAKLDSHDLGIFEAGISRKNEMTALASIIQPEIGIFSNLGDAHAEGFSSLKEKAEEKSKLFKTCKKIIYCSDHLLINETLTSLYSKDQLITWGQSSGHYSISYLSEESKTAIVIESPDIKQTFYTQLLDNGSLENITHCIIFCLEYDLTPSQIQYGLDLLTPISMRMEIKEGVNANLILNDSYNNDLSGIKMALDLAKKIDHQKSKILILSDLLQNDTYSPQFIEELTATLEYGQLNQLLFVGKESKKISTEKFNSSFFFDTTKELIQHLDTTLYKDSFFIIKGARQFEFEKVSKVLEHKGHQTRVEVNLSTLVKNYNYYKSLLKPETKVMAMVKAFAYGTGMIEVAKLLEFNQIDYLAVAYTDEGVLLRRNGVLSPIMVMNAHTGDYSLLKEHNLEPEIYDLDQLRSFEVEGGNLLYHLKFDTGMHRLGFNRDSFPFLIDYLKDHPKIKIQSTLTHLAGTDESEHDSFTDSQIQKFKEFNSQLEQIIQQPFLKHALNSSGIERHTESQFNMVRLGIGLYGIGNTPEAQNVVEQVVTLKTAISQIRTVPANESIGYSRKGQVNRESRIATIPVGYADGYDRRFSNGIGHVSINSVLAPVIGNVCMDMTMIDVTDLDCSEGDEVIIYSSEISIAAQAKKIDTIPYELLTHLSERVRRIFYFD